MTVMPPVARHEGPHSLWLEVAMPLIQLVEEGARGEDAGYQAPVATANGVQVRQVRIAGDNETRLTQVGDASDVVVVRVCTHALDYVPGQLLGDLRRMVMEPQHIIPNLL
jgi:hypothetical protein